MDIYLSRFVSSEDVVTPVGEEPEFLSEDMLPVFNRRRRFQNYAGYINQLSGIIVRDRIGHERWNSYFTFCFERSPLSKVKSMFRFKMADLNAAADPYATFVDSFYPDFVSDGFRFIDKGRVIVDKIGRQETLLKDFGEICDRLGLPFDGKLDVRSKTQFSESGALNFSPDRELVQAIADSCAMENLPPSSPAVLPWCEARIAHRNGRHDLAMARIDDARSRDDDFLPALSEQASILSSQKDHELATDRANALLDRNPSEIRYRTEAAQIFQRAGDKDKALSIMEEAIERSPKNPRLLMANTRLLLKMKKTSQAISNLKGAQRLLKPNSPSWLEANVLMKGLQETPKSWSTHIEGLRAKPNPGGDFTASPGKLSYIAELGVLRGLAPIWTARGEAIEAADLLLDPRLIEGDEGKSLLGLLKACKTNTDPAIVLDILRRTLQLNPTFPRLYKLMLQILPDKAPTAVISQLVRGIEAHCQTEPGLLRQADQLKALKAAE